MTFYKTKNKTKTNIHDKYNQKLQRRERWSGRHERFPKMKYAILVGSLKLLVSLHKPNS